MMSTNGIPTSPAPQLALVSATLGLMVCGSMLPAETVGWWRFEDSPSFLSDSGPNGLDLESFGFPEAMPAPIVVGGRGSTFADVAVANGGSNANLADFPVQESAWLAVPDDPAFEVSEFTIEAFVNRNTSATAFFHLAAQYDTSNNDRGWSFAIAAAGGCCGLTAGDMYMLGSEDGASVTVVDSDLIIEDGKDYYVAASFDLSGGMTTFYAQNLTDGGPMEEVTVDHPLIELNDSVTDFTIGALGPNQPVFSGVIDEVRLSNTILDPVDLLINSWPGAEPVLQPGDADQDLDFDQLDLVQVQIAAKYLTGPYAALDQAAGQLGDSQTSLVYNRESGELSVDAPAANELTSINITSAGEKFLGDKPAVLDGAFDNFAADNVFKATFGGSFGNISFGHVLPTGLSSADVAADLTAVGSLSGGGDLGNVDLVYIPEPSTVFLVGLSLVAVYITSWNRCSELNSIVTKTGFHSAREFRRKRHGPGRLISF